MADVTRRTSTTPIPALPTPILPEWADYWPAIDFDPYGGDGGGILVGGDPAGGGILNPSGGGGGMGGGGGTFNPNFLGGGLTSPVLPVLPSGPKSDPTPMQRCNTAFAEIDAILDTLNKITQADKFFPAVKIFIGAMDLMKGISGSINDYNDRAKFLEDLLGLESTIVGLIDGAPLSLKVILGIILALLALKDAIDSFGPSGKNKDFFQNLWNAVEVVLAQVSSYWQNFFTEMALEFHLP